MKNWFVLLLLKLNNRFSVNEPCLNIHSFLTLSPTSLSFFYVLEIDSLHDTLIAKLKFSGVLGFPRAPLPLSPVQFFFIWFFWLFFTKFKIFLQLTLPFIYKGKMYAAASFRSLFWIPLRMWGEGRIWLPRLFVLCF